MRIYSMTATFGKLEHEALTLQPGLNIIHAPNEWGKSTWCAFLVAMLYGLETRTHSTKTALSDKEHYAPWSGAPMEGSMDLCWDGRDVTIQRRTKGRSIFGEFKAYETHTGLPVPELTAANCGQQLLGVEKSVFTRSAFLRLSDLPVTQDEALRRRLNALVTTGDESGAADLLDRRLRELKNRCRYNRTGLLPQAEAEAAELERKLRELDALEFQSRRCREQSAELEDMTQKLENHRQALQYRASRENARRVQLAQQEAALSAARLREQEARCASLPEKAQAEQEITQLRRLQEELSAAQSQAQRLLPPEDPRLEDSLFAGMTPEAALQKVRQDTTQYTKLQRTSPLLLILGILSILAGVALFFCLPQYPLFPWIAAGMGAVLIAAWAVLLYRHRADAQAISDGYGSTDTALWNVRVQDYVNRQTNFQQVRENYEESRRTLDEKIHALQEAIAARCGSLTPARQIEHWQKISAAWDALEAARREHRHQADKAQSMESMIQDVAPPRMPDMLTYTEQETARLLADAAAQLRQLQRRSGQCQGQMEAIGQRTTLEALLSQLRRRIASLEEHYAALSLAQTTLEQARAELQRRFAPRIAKRAQALMSRLTEGRYDRLVLAEDLSIHATAQNEDTLRTALWRSDGTADQLYLALRLAVAEALTPNAPLILDDALVRFDDERLKAAMEVLRDEAKDRQVILFTCQSRESQLQ